CVHCKSRIESPRGFKGTSLSCGKCGRSFPLVGRETPIFSRDPERQISDTYVKVEHEIRAIQNKSKQLAARVSRGSKRAAACKVIIEGLRHNVEVARAIQAAILPRLSTEQQATLKQRLAGPVQPQKTLPEQAFGFLKRRAESIGELVESKIGGKPVDPRRAADATSIGYMLRMYKYMRNDWGGSPLCEARIAAIEAAVFPTLREHAADKSAALVLGAGMARFAWDLLPMFQHVIAAEASIPAAVLHDMLQRGEVITCEPEEQSAYTIADQGRQTVSSISRTYPWAGKEPPPGHGDLVFCAADASAMPLADRSISAVVSIYFTDVLPLSLLLPEVKRLLKPGGVYLHFGPLAYHFDDFDEMWSAEEVRAIFASHGFEIRSDRFVDDCKRTEATMFGPFFNAWCFCAVYRG
ncbi:MAG: methyltransferase domain-containing protein, partial [Minicystis sp.]